MRPWVHKAATSAMVTVIAGGGMAATAIIAGRPHAAPRPPALAQGGPSPAPSTSASPGPSAGRSVAHSAPPYASVSPVVAVRFSPATALVSGGGQGSGFGAEAATGGTGSTAPSSPPPGPTPAPSPGRSPSCTAGVALAGVKVCARVSIALGG